jgi:sugar lactone lactonase YvrE
MASRPETAVRAQATLGEGPVWDAAAGRLVWVDILGSRVHWFDPVTGRDEAETVAQHVGAALPRRGGGLVLNLRDGVGLRDPDGAFRWLTDLAAEGRRGNDAAVDATGTLWAGTMRYDEAPGGGALYRICADGKTETVLDSVTVSNGLGWSPDNRLMYYIDSPTGRIDVFDADVAAGRVTGRRVFAEIDRPGLPDGLTVDESGCVWVALWMGGAVLRYSPYGTLDRVIEIPASRTTACAFGGPQLTDLYVTTATAENEPGSGALWVIPDAGKGLPAPEFAG